MRQKKLLLLLALLLTAATGAWAQNTKRTITIVSDKGKTSMVQQLPYTMTLKEMHDSNTGMKYDDVSDRITGLLSANPSVVSVGEFNGGNTSITVLANGNAQLTMMIDNGMASFDFNINVTRAPTYTVKMKDGVKDAGMWTITPTTATTTGVDEGDEVTLQYTGRLKVKGVKATEELPAGNIVDLSGLTADYEAKDGDVLTGWTSSYRVTIAAGATVTLAGATIESFDYYCIKCAGDATIILKDDEINTLTSMSPEHPALWVGDKNTTLTIQGNTGELNVRSSYYLAGIGGGFKNTNSTCGNIRIEGGIITAQGGYRAAGIGSDRGPATCGNITIIGGNVEAVGGGQAAGIGSGYGKNGEVSSCGDITIANTVTKVTAKKGSDAENSIGKGYGEDASCGTVTIGGTTGAISTSPYTYQPNNN